MSLDINVVNVMLLGAIVVFLMPAFIRWLNSKPSPHTDEERKAAQDAYRNNV